MVLLFKQIGAPLPSWLVDLYLGAAVPDASLLSLLLCLLCTAVLLLGVKESARVNMVVTVANVAIILFIVVMGSLHVTPGNWIHPGTVHLVPSNLV